MRKTGTLFYLFLILIMTGLLAKPGNGQSAEIVRDHYWIPHIIGDTPMDCAFGLAIAMCQDHPKVIVDKILNQRGELARFYGSGYEYKDFLARAFQLHKKAEETLPALPDDVRRYLDGFSAGINYYFNLEANKSKLPTEVPAESFLPVSSSDVSASFALLLLNHEYFQFKKDAGTYLSKSGSAEIGFKGMSNQWIVQPQHTTDEAAYLLCDPHLPFTGLTASWEAHLLSRDGKLDFEGIFFEGTIFPAMGHNRTLAWSHTSNSPDFADAYLVTLDTEQNDSYIMDGQSKPFNLREEIIEIKDETPDTIIVRQSDELGIEIEKLSSQQSLFAKLQIEKQAPPIIQGYRMITAKDVSDFKTAMELLEYDKWNTMVLDNTYNMYYVFNGRVYRRPDAYAARTQALSGSESTYLWGELIPFSELPDVENPSSGILVNCNDAPWYVCDNLDYDSSTVAKEIHMGDYMTQRGLRARELLYTNQKMDLNYLKEVVLDAKITSRDSIAPVLESAVNEAKADSFEHIDRAEGLANVILSWDGFAHRDSAQASLFYTWHQFIDEHIKFLKPAEIDSAQKRSMLESLIDAANYLENNFDSLNVPWGALHRMRHGGIWFPLSGGTSSNDEMEASRLGKPVEYDEKGRMNVGGGNVMIYLIRIKSGESPRVWTMKPYGQVADSTSPNYSTHATDLSALYSADSLRETWYEETAFRAHAEITEKYNYSSLLDNNAGSKLPQKEQLLAWPNPFNPTLTIHYIIPGPSAQKIELKVYDVLGRVVQILNKGKINPGIYKLQWTPAKRLASGVYFLQLNSPGSFTINRKVILLK